MKTLSKINIFVNRLPLVVAFFLSIFWGFIYLFSTKLHGMPAMFDQQFPFLFAKLLGIHNESMSVVSGVFLAMLDAGIFGIVLGWLLRAIFKGAVTNT